MGEFLYREMVQYEHRNGESLRPTMAGTYELHNNDEVFRAVLDVTPVRLILRCTHAPAEYAKLINKEIMLGWRTKVYGPLETCRRWRERLLAQEFRGISLRQPDAKPLVLKKPGREPQIYPDLDAQLSLRLPPAPPAVAAEAAPEPQPGLPDEIALATTDRGWGYERYGYVIETGMGMGVLPLTAPGQLVADRERASAIRSAREVEKRLQLTANLEMADRERVLSQNLERAIIEQRRQGEIMATRAANEVLRRLSDRDLRELDSEELIAIVERVSAASGRPPEEIGAIIQDYIARDRKVAQRLDRSAALAAFRVFDSKQRGR